VPSTKPKVRSFESAADFRRWLTKNRSKSDGVWLRIFKKDSGIATVSYAQALDEALCFGWIDGQKDSYDESSWLQRFCPRRAKSKWSKINQSHAERLIKSKKMTAPGLQAILAAKKDGRWKAAYDSPVNSSLPRDFIQALNENEKAKSFFKTLNRTNVYAITYRIQTAKKPETRQRWIKRVVEMLERGETFH
jgi:uncharacterized protein YdeI (YjbR/CyaY-like superfamily)